MNITLLILLLCSSMHCIHSNADYQTLFNQANEAFHRGAREEAIKLYKQLTLEQPNIPQAFFNLGISYKQEERFAEAIDAFKRAINLDPNYTKAFHHLGEALQKQGLIDQAEEMFLKAHELDPTYFDVIPPLAYLLRDKEDFEAAIIYFHKAVTLRPQDIQMILELANTLNTYNRTEEALEWYFKLLDRLPNNASVLYNIAYTLKKMNRLHEAINFYHRALEANPNNSEAHFSYGLALLVTGDSNADNWAQGWEEYEWRWKRHDRQTMRQYMQPLWDGSDLTDKILFIWAEQGLGDTFEFIRYAKVAKDMGAKKVIVAVQKPLLDIMRLCPYIDQVIWTQEQPPYFDYHVPMLSMPFYTKVTLDSVPDEVPYLFADEALIEEWREILEPDTNFKIGICWQGNPNYSTQFLRMAVAAKSMAVEKFLPIMNLPNVSVYSLQKTTGTDQLSGLPDNAPLIVFGDDFDQSKGRFMDTAAVIKNLDLVISIDTSICHLAAGLGVPTWNLLPNPPDWRWMLHCDTTPWYHNMRLFRQPTPGDWDSVISKVVTELEQHFAYGKPLLTFEKPL